MSSKIKLLAALQNVNKSQENSAWPSYSDFFNDFGISYWDSNENFYTEWESRMKGYYLIKWLCTDTWVGAIAYFLDDELVAMSWQNARKNDTNYSYVSNEAAEKIRSFLYSLCKLSAPTYNLIDPEEDIDTYYQVSYTSQLLVEDAIYDGQKVKIKREHSDWQKPVAEWSRVNVTFPSGETIRVDLDQIQIPLHLEKKDV